MLPGKYRVRLLLRQNGVTHGIEGEQAFHVTLYGEGKGPGDRKAILVFQQKVTTLKRAVAGTLSVASEVEKRLGEIGRAIDQTPGLTVKDANRVHALKQRLNTILRALRGDVALRKRNENTPLSIAEKVETIIDDQRFYLGRPTATQERLYAEASGDFGRELGKLRELINKDVRELEKRLEAEGAPWTPGRLPEWQEK